MAKQHFVNENYDDSGILEQFKNLENIKLSTMELAQKIDNQINDIVTRQVQMETRINQLLQQRISLLNQIANKESSMLARMGARIGLAGNAAQMGWLQGAGGAVAGSLAGGAGKGSFAGTVLGDILMGQQIGASISSKPIRRTTARVVDPTTGKTIRELVEESRPVGLESLPNHIGKIGGWFKKLPFVGKMLGVTAAANLPFQMMDKARDVHEKSTGLGLGALTYQQYHFAGSLFGADAIGAYSQFRESYTAAQRGSGPEREALNRFGIGMNQTPQAAFEQMGAAMSRATNEVQKMKDTITIFGAKANDAAIIVNKLNDKRVKAWGISDEDIDRLAYSKEKVKIAWDGIVNATATGVAKLLGLLSKMYQPSEAYLAVQNYNSKKGATKGFEMNQAIGMTYAMLGPAAALSQMVPGSFEEFVLRNEMAKSAQTKATSQWKEYDTYKPDLSHLAQMGSFISGKPYESYGARTVQQQMEDTLKQIQQNTKETAAALK